jgi:hypothetical protein
LEDKIRSGKKQGGQPGQGKHEQKVIPTEDVRQLVPEQCKDCQTPLSGIDPEPRLHQHLEIPPISDGRHPFPLASIDLLGLWRSYQKSGPGMEPK